MTCSIVPSGLRQYANDDILLLGGYSRSGSTPDGTVGAGFIAFDARQIAAGMTLDSARIGTVELFLIKPQLERIHGLINIEVCPALRRRGIGRRIVEAIAATAPDTRLKIYDIQQDAVLFWIRLGCAFHPRPPAWDGYFSLQTKRAERRIAAPPDQIGVIPASRLRPVDRSPG